ncbi:MAG: isoprenyl transferase [Candidatus Neomarinimicrobiota bacterium]|nr:MAG: isoprenyl transferase [Candidatus Neomarinimicrobiota bacterium]
MDTTALRDQITRGNNLPVHIAIIMDGNGRWAKQHRLPRIAGHREGINSVREITRVCGELGIRHLTLYTFSTENWRRPPREVSALMNLLLNTIRAEVDELHKNQVRLTTIGDLSGLPGKTRQGLVDGMEKTRNNTGLNLNLALNYGSRQEMVRAVHKLLQDVQSGTLDPKQVDETLLGRYLDTGDMPDPDLLIRTGGEYRLSNFLLWQCAYTEFMVTETYWPDFREQQLLEAINEYQNRERRYGMISEQLQAED